MAWWEWEEGSVWLKLTHIVVQHKPVQHCKAIILQLKKKNKQIISSILNTILVQLYTLANDLSLVSVLSLMHWLQLLSFDTISY